MKAYTPTNWVRRKTWIGIILIAIGTLLWWVEKIKENSVKHKLQQATQSGTTTTLSRLPTEKRWEPTVPVVVAMPNKVSDPVSIPFGKDFWIDTKGAVYCFKNGRPFLWNGQHLILMPGVIGIPFGTDCRQLAFQSAEANNVIVVVHLRDHQY